MLDWSKRGEEGQSTPHSHINWEEEEEEEEAMEGGVGEAPPHTFCVQKNRWKQVGGRKRKSRGQGPP